MKRSSIYAVFPMPVMLGVQLTISHLVAVAVALWLANRVGAALALLIAVMAGHLLTLTLHRTLWLLDLALGQVTSMPSRWHGALTPLVARANRLLAQAEDVSNLRKNLIHRVQDTAAQQERNRLARDLHDSIKQQIFSIHMSAAAAQARWTHDPQGAQTALDDVRRSAQEAMVEMNALLQEVAPAPLEKVGLVQALHDQCKALGYRSGAEVQIEIGELPDDDQLPAGAQQSVFRIVQEALSNIARHARAHHVSVSLGRHEQRLVLQIVDDGQGFEMAKAETGMGLTNLRQRVMELHGTLDITSSPGAGTQLRAAIPLVASVHVQEEPMNTPTNHTLNKVCLVGLVGGLALIATLYYPLYGVLPSAYVAGWQQGSALLSIVLQAAAALIAIGIGYAAARVSKADSRRGAVLFGAVAGGIAGMALYIGLAGAAAGVIGSSSVIQHGLVPADDNTQFLSLLSTSVIGTIWWTYTVLWGALLAGLSLGAIGGLLAPTSSDPTPWPVLRYSLVVPLNVATLAGASNLLAMFIVYQLLEQSLRKLVEAGITEPLFPVAGVSILPIATAYVIYGMVLVGRFLVLRAESRGEYTHILFTRPLSTGISYVVTALAMPSIVLIAAMQNAVPASLLNVLLVGFGVCLVLSLIFLRFAVGIRREKQAAGTLPPVTRRSVASLAGMLLALAIAMALGTAFGLWMLTVLINQPVVLTIVVVVGIVVLVRFGRGRKNLLPAGVSIPGEAYAQSGLIALQTHVGSIITSVTAATLILLSGASVPLTLTLILVTAIIPLSSFDREFVPLTQTMAQVVQGNYLTHLGGLLYVFIIVTVIFGLLTLFAWGILRIRLRIQNPPRDTNSGLAAEL